MRALGLVIQCQSYPFFGFFNSFHLFSFPKIDLVGPGYFLQWPIRRGPARKEPFFRFQLYKRVGISQVEVSNKLGKSVI